MIDNVDNILNVLLDEELIELPLIIESKFPIGVPKHFHYEEFYNYHRVLGYLTCNCRSLKHIIQDFIYQGDIKLDARPNMQVGPVHSDNE